MGIESYASPGLRWSILLEDHPGATYSFSLKKGSDLDIPASYGGDGDFCVCTIVIPGGQNTVITAYKPIKPKGNADEWNILCTKTLGRALKKAGYPDNMNDLKALVLWRQRRAEIQGISTGNFTEIHNHTPKALEAALDEAETTEEAADTEVDLDDQVIEAEIVEDEPTEIQGNLLDEDDLVVTVRALDKDDKLSLKAFIEEHGGHLKPEDWDNYDRDLVESWLLGRH